MALDRVNRVSEKQRKVRKGRPNKVRAGDLEALIEKIHLCEDAFDVKIANNLDKMYDMMYKMAMAEGEFKDIGIKDQKTALSYCIGRQEAILDDLYLNKQASGETKEEEEKEASKSAPLLSLANLK